ncbi:MAG: 2-hydroxyacyl-CoA dehydratase [Clostridia bacterium]|nr:2-hydroxyacyl-CoA dehydratase [Clostridia bacterium]
MKIGLDIGSTTLKCAVFDENEKLIHSEYERHFSMIREKAVDMLERINNKFPGAKASLSISGSAGMGLAESAGINFVQEVYATKIAVDRFIPNTDVVIELGGEDAKIIFLDGALEVRMNGSCAGGTGAFIDQMASLLSVEATEMNELAKKAEKIYTVASRCGVFAKSDIQPLLNQGAKKTDISASIFAAVVNQTIAGLAQGRQIKGKIVYLGGPLTFFSQLRESFDKALDEKGIHPENSLYYVAMGASLMSDGEEVEITALTDKIKNAKIDAQYKSSDPLFESEAEFDEFRKRHELSTIEETADAKEVYLGIDAGSTTIKAIVIDENGAMLTSQYMSNHGNPVVHIKEFLEDFYKKYPDVKIRSSAVTGYGEEIIKNAFNVDFGIVETMAHFIAAKKFCPEVDFIIDIGGQDIKCFKIRNGVVDNIFLNEACSSGCGSFLQTFAGALGYSIEEFAKIGLFADKPVDLGSRCTVFMNSSVKQAQKDGATIENISAGLSSSVVKNALYKVIRASSADDLGKNIVVQGGTFHNDAVLRAFEKEIGRNVIRPAISGLMGAYGAALYAKSRNTKASTIITPDELKVFEHKATAITCKGCSNNCKLTVNTFNSGKKYISGNRCEKPITNTKSTDDSLNMFNFKRNLLDAYKPEKGTRGRIGIPMGLNMYEMLPFWHTFFTKLGFEVVTSPKSTHKLYRSGQHTIPSDTVCYPAKLVHGHIEALLNEDLDAIFYPCLGYNFDEGKSNNHYNCPVVAFYPEVIQANTPGLKNTKFIYNYIGIHRRKNLTPRAHKMMCDNFGKFTKSEVKKALDAAYDEYYKHLDRIEKEGDRLLAYAEKENKPVIILCGRPYHIDPEICHGIDTLVSSFGAVIVTEDAVSRKVEEFEVNVLNQWTYHSRLYLAAKYAGEHKNVNLIQLVSFGCGVDAVTTDEVRAILEAGNKIYTQIKIDEITNLGAVKIRLRSLFAALEQEAE